MQALARFSIVAVVVMVCSFNAIFAAQSNFSIRQATDADLPGCIELCEIIHTTVDKPLGIFEIPKYNPNFDTSIEDKKVMLFEPERSFEIGHLFVVETTPGKIDALIEVVLWPYLHKDEQAKLINLLNTSENFIPDFVEWQQNHPGNDALRIKKLYVCENLRRKGIGKALIKYAIEKFKPQKLYCDVYQKNIDALKFWKRIGFKEIGVVWADFTDACVCFEADASL